MLSAYVLKIVMETENALTEDVNVCSDIKVKIAVKVSAQITAVEKAVALITNVKDIKKNLTKN